ncbi:ribonucleotide reductase inhibitor-domain-containing protein [Xylariomycetidae sp. FL2044]|nr:ribonucleotide reductase inhibitor-domain-containing protein [Xylariomycetidae sp. FL2044]
MSAPRPKRQFAGAASDPSQRQITSFFSSSTTTATTSTSSSPTSPESISTPDSLTNPTVPLPSFVQANLLSVGMRVRKSVPEGYKTGSYSASSLCEDDDDDNNFASYAQPTASSPSMGERRSRANAISTPRELVPFCGIHNVGGMDIQPENPHYYVPSLSTPFASSVQQPYLGVDDIDDVPGLTSSQDSVDSTDSHFSAMRSPRQARKRYFVEDEEEQQLLHHHAPNRLHIWNDHHPKNHTADTDFDGEVSPRSLAPAGWGNAAGRRAMMAMPRKGRLRRKMLTTTMMGSPSSSSHHGGVGAGEQENFMVVDDGANDFEEAEFLDRKPELGYRDHAGWGEVEMGGI